MRLRLVHRDGSVGPIPIFAFCVSRHMRVRWNQATTGKNIFLMEFADLTFALQIREVAAVANIKPTPPGGQIQTALNGSLVSPAGGFRSTLPAAATAFKGAITLTSHAPCSAGELGDGSFRFQDPQGLEANPSAAAWI